jgi:hypothetical protein
MNILGFNIGGDELKGLGSIAGALASAYSIKETKDYQDKMLGFEKDRVKAEREKDKKRQEAYESVWGTDVE